MPCGPLGLHLGVPHRLACLILQVSERGSQDPCFLGLLSSVRGGCWPHEGGFPPLLLVYPRGLFPHPPFSWLKLYSYPIIISGPVFL